MLYIKLTFAATILFLSWRNCYADPPFLNCPENLVYQDCGSLCTRTCETPVIVTCKRPCVEKCGCPHNIPILHNGRCITKSECPREGQKPVTKPKEDHDLESLDELCPETQVYQVCGSKCNRTCAHGKEMPACVHLCVRRCGCPPERSYWHNGKCVSFEQCTDTEDVKASDGDNTEDSPAAEKAKTKFVESTYTQILKFFGLS